MDQKKFYNEQANSFVTHKQLFGQVDQYGIEFIEKIIGNHNDKILLDYWCGAGDIAIKHLSRWAKAVFGVDISKELIGIALQKTMQLENIEFMSIDAHNIFFDTIVMDNLFDYIVSYYVFCTIKDKKIIEQIAVSLYRKMKVWATLLTMMPNRDKFHGKECYWFSCINTSPLLEWDEVVTYLRTNSDPLPIQDSTASSHLRITDFFWSQQSMKESFEKAWFQVTLHELIIPTWSYDGIMDEDVFSPIYVLEARK